MLSDPGLGWHLRNIDAMIVEGGWLHRSVSQPHDGVVQSGYESMLGELPFWLGNRWAGKEGIAAVATLILAFQLRLLYTRLLRRMVCLAFAVFWLLCRRLCVVLRMGCETDLFTMLFVMLTVRLVEQSTSSVVPGAAALAVALLLCGQICTAAPRGFLILVPQCALRCSQFGVSAVENEERRAARHDSTRINGRLLPGDAVQSVRLDALSVGHEIVGNGYFMIA